MPHDSDAPIPDQALTELREENRRLRTALEATHAHGQRGVSRRGLLAGGATVLAASAGAGVFAPLKDLSAAPDNRRLAAAVSPLGGSRLPAQFQLVVVGSKQGRFIGDVNGDGFPDLISGLKYDHSVTTPRDAATGQSTGRRVHKPITIMKEVDRASPMFFQALVSNENLTSVSMSFLGDLGAGAFGVVYRIDLANAQVASFEQMIGNVADEEETSPRMMEEITFTYRKITFTSIQGGKSATDDWTQ